MAEGAKLPILLWASGAEGIRCAKAEHLLLAEEQSLPAGIKVRAEARKTLYCQHPAEIV